MVKTCFTYLNKKCPYFLFFLENIQLIHISVFLIHYIYISPGYNLNKVNKIETTGKKIVEINNDIFTVQKGRIHHQTKEHKHARLSDFKPITLNSLLIFDEILKFKHQQES